MKIFWLAIMTVSSLFSLHAFGDALDCSALGFAPKSSQVHFTAQGTPYDYTIQVGFLPVMSTDKIGQACMAYTSYSRKDTASSSSRPISFLMNGGPGNSSDFLHFAGVGPMRMNFGVDGTDLSQGSTLSANPNTLLDFTDLVFVDPIGTGYSVLAPGTQLSQFQGVQKDADSIGDFINSYLIQFQKTASPTFVIGESYSGTRVPVLTDYLFTSLKVAITGMVLISPQLDALGDSGDFGNDLPHITSLPGFATVNWYYKKLAPENQKIGLEDIYQKAKRFANGVYAEALMKGNTLNSDTQALLSQKLADLTGVPKDIWSAFNLRVPFDSFPLIPFDVLDYEKPKADTSFYDGRIVATDPSVDPLGNIPQLDTAASNYFSSTFGITGSQYVSAYDPFANGKMWSTDNPGYFDEGAYRSGLQQLNSDLFNMPKLKVYVASGLFDGVCPTGEVEYMLARISEWVSGRIQITHYPSGHMVYMGSENAKKLHTELQSFYENLMPQVPTPVAN